MFFACFKSSKYDEWHGRHPLLWEFVGVIKPTFSNITSLAKLFMYGNYVRARSYVQSITPKEVVEKELGHYPYERRDAVDDPYFTPVDISEANLGFHAAMTDAGICQVYNGNSLSSTYTTTDRIMDIEYSIDTKKGIIKPDMIQGTGKISETTMWLDARISNSILSLQKINNERGKLQVSINEWLSYYNVLINQLEFRAGTEVIIKVKPSVHRTSPNFKELPIEKRKCLYMNENQVMILRGYFVGLLLVNIFYANSRMPIACSNFIGKKDASLNAD